MRGFFHAGNGGFHKIYFSPSFRSFFTFLGIVVGVRWRHFVQLTQNRVFSPIPTRFHLKAKRLPRSRRNMADGDAGFVIVSFIKRLNKYDR